MAAKEPSKSNEGINVTKIREVIKLTKDMAPHFNEVEFNTFMNAMNTILINMEARMPKED